MKKILIIALSLLPVAVWACPNCAGSENAKDQYTVYILAGFILLTYIPFYILFKMAHKKRKQVNQ